MRFLPSSIAGLLLSALTIATAGPQAALAANVSANIKGTLSGPSAGACSSGYANQCASGTCVNFTAVGTPTAKGTFGRGTVSNFCVTTDLGDNVDAPADADGKDTCSPIFGILMVSATKGISTTDTALNFAGVYCDHQKNSPNDAIQGGFGVDGANSTDTNETGWGTVTGTVGKGTPTFTLKLKGSVSP